MSGQSAAMSVKQVKSTIHSVESNSNSNKSGGGKEMNTNVKPGSALIGGKK